ncbi:protein of unknown function [Legionella fallonii LLAP-10]|uniref:Uncharacterized protein n=1 Tax=Legionella fallonii LLAP-10 TaxID=1212491 RepID=A0A098G125_9GAMM|nr:protein of unknown function [Legionella fallonii LLAP-10]
MVGNGFVDTLLEFSYPGSALCVSLHVPHYSEFGTKSNFRRITGESRYPYGFEPLMDAGFRR